MENRAAKHRGNEQMSFRIRDGCSSGLLEKFWPGLAF
jgi:hypothetical protein